MFNKQVFHSILELSLIFFAAGCKSKGFHRGELQDQIGVTKPVYNDNEIKEAFAKKANLPKPFKLAVYFKKPVERLGSNKQWRWSENDKATGFRPARLGNEADGFVVTDELRVHP